MHYMIIWFEKGWFSVLLLAMCISSVCPYADITVYSIYTHQEVDGGFIALTSRFGPRIPLQGFVGMIVYADPPLGCTPVQPPPSRYRNLTRHWILLVSRGNCTFEDKIRIAQASKYDMVIVHSNMSAAEPMTVANRTGINVPSVVVNKQVGLKFKQDYQYFNSVYVSIDDTADFPFDLNADLLIPFAVVVSVCTITMITLMICKCIRDRRRARRYRLPASSLKRIPIEKFCKGSRHETCAICLDDYVDGEKLRILPCAHGYHSKCIDPWLTKRRRVCPICKRKVFAADETPTNDTESDTDSDNDERTPLVRTEPVTQQPASLRPSLLDRERLLARLRIARTMRRLLNDNSTSSGSSNTNGHQQNGNETENAPTVAVVNSINSTDNDSILDISPNGSIYSYNSSASQARHSNDSQCPVDNNGAAGGNGPRNLSVFYV